MPKHLDLAEPISLEVISFFGWQASFFKRVMAVGIDLLSERNFIKNNKRQLLRSKIMSRQHGAIPEMPCVFHPKPLKTLAEIQVAFGVSQRKIKEWYDQGAPIIKSSGGYSAEYMMLYMWRLQQRES